ncbi:hypothetical protein GCM10011613_12480 [Cellvibrio zantedeschiae]|uniref:RiboL-PSP-HEPN domain-containing protein n=1 Tax=Cellvibrio zantedeschiae TaxID=1237077 RepID=A0ABQ3AWL9_9GAMM|nr:hypothetical protein [Cellvibrio zantedeschiae]GGY69639.1 hypothetical protein GCM10011613_12480 [Cellvibrio zantedeschiae]
MTESNNLLQDTSDLYGDEIIFVLENLRVNPNDFWSRSLIRLCISLFEAEVFILKKNLLKYCKEYNVPIKPEISTLLAGIKYEINDNGKVAERYFQIKMVSDIKFVFDQLRGIRGFTLKNKFSDSRWQCMEKTVKVRNRLVHPKLIEEQIVSEIEVNDCMSAYWWFSENINHIAEQELNFLEQETTNLKSKLKKLQLDITKRQRS